MDDAKWERWAGLGGILFVILVLVSAFLPGNPPMQTDSTAKIARYFNQHRDDIRWAAYIGSVAAVPFLWWLGSVWARLRRSEGATPRLAVVAVAGGIFGTVMATAARFGVAGILSVGADGGHCLRNSLPAVRPISSGQRDRCPSAGQRRHSRNPGRCVDSQLAAGPRLDRRGLQGGGPESDSADDRAHRRRTEPCATSHYRGQGDDDHCRLH